MYVVNIFMFVLRKNQLQVENSMQFIMQTKLMYKLSQWKARIVRMHKGNNNNYVPCWIISKNKTNNGYNFSYTKKQSKQFFYEQW